MLENLTISLSKTENKGQYRVVAKWGGLEYLECFDPTHEWKRRAFAKNALSMFGWTDAAEELVSGVMRAVLEELARVEKPAEKRMDQEQMDTMQGDGGTRWLWPGRIALDSLCVLAGDPGLGKSVLTLDIAAHATQGAPWPDGSGFSPVTSVLLLSAEDSFVNTIRPRLVAAGADLGRVTALKGVIEGDVEGTPSRMFDLAQDLETLKKSIEEVAAPRLLVIDPISAYLGAVSENANAEVRALLRPLAEMAAATATAIILVSHLRKAKGPSLHRIIGSIAFAAVARSAFVVQRVKESGSQERRLVPAKCNLEVTRTALRFRVEKHPEYPQPHVVWSGEEAHEGVDMDTGSPGPARIISPEALARMDERLALGPATFGELKQLLAELAPPKRTLYRAISDRYQWLDEKQGKARLITLKTPGGTDDERGIEPKA